MSEHTPSQAALKAAVELEIEGCIGHITTRGLALKIDAVARASNEAKIDALTKALQGLVDVDERRPPLIEALIRGADQYEHLHAYNGAMRRARAALSSHTEQEGE